MRMSSFREFNDAGLMKITKTGVSFLFDYFGKLTDEESDNIYFYLTSKLIFIMKYTFFNIGIHLFLFVIRFLLVISY